MEKIKEMLDKANEIVEKYDKKERESGQKFNLFSILDRETDEVKTHSAIIADLLNPFGSHGQGNTFLYLFFDMLKQLKSKSSDYWKNAKIPEYDQVKDMQVYTERNIGKYKGIDCRLDILLLNKEWQICIENKFDAKQGEEQLERYSDYLDKDKARNTLLIYLTKNGDGYKSKTLMKGTNYYCLSYKKDILDWTNSCIKECSNIPIIQQSLIQYVNLIKQETNQTISKEMKTDIQQLIRSCGIKGAKKICDEYDNVLKDIINDLKMRVEKKLSEDDKILKIVSNDKPFSSLFLTIKDFKYSVGIEDFNMHSHEEGALFIGLLNFDKKDDDEEEYWKTYWLKNQTREKIWNNKDNLFSKIEKYGKYEDKRDSIAQEIVDYVQDYIKRITTNK